MPASALGGTVGDRLQAGVAREQAREGGAEEYAEARGMYEALAVGTVERAGAAVGEGGAA